MKLRIIQVLAVLLVLSTTGCVYWRLHQFRNQLTAFTDHFRVQEGDSPALIAFKPILYPEDVEWLIGLKPTRVVAEGPDRVRHIYHMDKRLARKHRDDPIREIVFSIVYEDNRLKEYHFPKSFETFLTEANFIDIFKPMDKAAIKKGENATQWSWEETDLVIPGREDIKHHLGEPFVTEDLDGGVVMRYAYTLRGSDHPRAGAEHFWLEFTTDSDEGQVIKAESMMGTLHTVIDLSKLPRELKLRRR